MENTRKSVKLVALKLSTLSWWDKVWFLNRFDNQHKSQIKLALKELSQLKISNKQELLQQFMEAPNKDYESTLNCDGIHPELQRLVQNSNDELPKSTLILLKSRIAKVVQEKV